MKRILLLLIFVLMTLTVSALSPGPEIECCYFIGIEDTHVDRELLSKECPQYELTEEKCEVMVSEWEAFVGGFSTGLETCYDDDGVNYPCDDPNLCYDVTGKVIDCSLFPGIGSLNIFTIIIYAIIALLIGIIIRLIIKKIRKS